jgi:hypothetical protein
VVSFLLFVGQMYILSISIHINLQNTQLLRMATRLTSYRSLIFLCLLENSSTLVAEQCAWAIGNVAGEGAELRNTLLAQGALWPLARLMLSNKGSTTRTAAWALSNLIKVVLIKSFSLVMSQLSLYQEHSSS